MFPYILDKITDLYEKLAQIKTTQNELIQTLNQLVSFTTDLNAKITSKEEEE